MAVSQEEIPDRGTGGDIPEFNSDVLSFAPDGAQGSRMDVFIQVPNERLSFVKSEEFYRASYEIVVRVESAAVLAKETTWTESVRLDEYTATVSTRTGKISRTSFFLPPAAYSVDIVVRDEQTNKSAHAKRAARVRDFSGGGLRLSDVMLVTSMGLEEEKTVIVPNVAGSIGDAVKEGIAFFEAYNGGGADTATMTATLRDPAGRGVRTDTAGKRLHAGKNSCFMRFGVEEIPPGEYTLDIRLVPAGAAPGPIAADTAASSARPVTILLRGIPSGAVDLDHAIDQLQYVADRDAIEEMKKAPAGKKKEMFVDFWKKRDPSPETETNELMDEYYRRVGFATKNFGHYIDGWKTDRGMVYIIFGPPNNIERHPFEMDSKPYEVWNYYQMNRKFVFVDATGFGDYRLQNPSWDVWRPPYR